MKAKATLKQIAKELNVSVSTVSKALNDSPEISEQTKTKIKEYAKLKNYKPNVIGLNLKNRKTKTIGVIIPNILNSFFAKVFSGIEKVADAKGYNVIMCISNESLEKEAHTLEMLSNGTIDGFILSVSEEAQKQNNYDHFKEIINDGTPIVMFDRIAEGIDCDKVIVDDFDSALDSTQRLIDLGCKNIALLSSVDNLSVGKLRFEGYLKDINSANAVVRGAAERNAVNAPIQGSAADIIKIAMINIHKRLIAENWKSKMLLQVHDELVFDVHNSEIEKIQPMIKHEMEQAVILSVPLEVEIGIGKDWLEAH